MLADLLASQGPCDLWCDLIAFFGNFWCFRPFGLCITCVVSVAREGTSPPPHHGFLSS